MIIRYVNEGGDSKMGSKHIHNEEKMNPISEVIHDIDIISNSTDKKRKKIVQRLKNAIKKLRSTQKKIKARLVHG